MSVYLESNIEEDKIRAEATDGDGRGGGDLKTRSPRVTFQYDNHHITFIYFIVVKKDSSTSSSVVNYY